MKIFYILLIFISTASCGSAGIKSKEISESTTFDKSKYDPKWIGSITEMADTDDWVVLKDDAHFILVQVLTSNTNRHYILYSKDAQFDINGLAYMKIKAPSCIEIHVYNCDIDKLNFSIKDTYSTDFAFEKLNTFIFDELLKLPEPISVQKTSINENEMQRTEIMEKFDEVLKYLDSMPETNVRLNKLKEDIREILKNKKATVADLKKAERLILELGEETKTSQ